MSAFSNSACNPSMPAALLVFMDLMVFTISFAHWSVHIADHNLVVLKYTGCVWPILNMFFKIYIYYIYIIY